MVRHDDQFLTTGRVRARACGRSRLNRWDPGDGVVTRIGHHGRIRVRIGPRQLLSPVMKPFPSANHDWAMAQGEGNLRPELARPRAAGDATVLDVLPLPTGPTFARRGRGASS